MIDLLTAKKDLNTQEFAILNSEFQRRKKSRLTLWLLWWFTGILGGHRYYLGNKGRAIAHTIVFIFCIIFSILWGAYITQTVTTMEDVIIYSPMGSILFIVPAFWAIIDAFFIGRQLAKINAKIEAEIIVQIKNMRSTTVPEAP